MTSPIAGRRCDFPRQRAGRRSGTSVRSTGSNTRREARDHRRRVFRLLRGRNRRRAHGAGVRRRRLRRRPAQRSRVPAAGESARRIPGGHAARRRDVREGCRPGDLEELKRRGVLWKSTLHEHSYPHCWRCETPLLYYARTSWFIRTTEFKDAMLVAELARRLASARDGRGPVRRVADQQHRLGGFARPLLGHAAPIWVCDRERHRTPRRSAATPSSRRNRACRSAKGSIPTSRSSTATRGNGECGGTMTSHARGDRRLVRFGVDAVRAMAFPVRESREVRALLSGRFHRRRASIRRADGSTRCSQSRPGSVTRCPTTSCPRCAHADGGRHGSVSLGRGQRSGARRRRQKCPSASATSSIRGR